MDGLEQEKDRLSSTICRDLPELRPLYADQWVINSLLQKSIRRGEVEVAQRAALTFLGARLRDLAQVHDHRIRGRRRCIARRCRHGCCGVHRCKLAEEIGR